MSLFALFDIARTKLNNRENPVVSVVSLHERHPRISTGVSETPWKGAVAPTGRVDAIAPISPIVICALALYADLSRAHSAVSYDCAIRCFQGRR